MKTNYKDITCRLIMDAVNLGSRTKNKDRSMVCAYFAAIGLGRLLDAGHTALPEYLLSEASCSKEFRQLLADTPILKGRFA